MQCIIAAVAVAWVVAGGENLVPNPGFEGDMAVERDSDGMPVRWGTHIGKGKAEFAVVETQPHGGRRCAHVKAHAPDPSGYWVSPRIGVTGGRVCRFSAWYRTKDVALSGRGVIFSLNFRKADNAWAGASREFGEPFTNPWTRIAFDAYAPPDATYVNVVIGLADSAGEMWIDDLSLADTGRRRSDMPETDAILARPFPQHWLPERRIGLVRDTVQPLLFLVQNRTKRKVTNPSVGLLLPEGVTVVGGDASVTPPAAGTPVEHEGQGLVRWLCPVERSARMRPVFDYYHGSLVCLKAAREPGAYKAYYFFSSKEESQPPQEMAVEVLPPLPEPARLGRFRIGFLLPDAVRVGAGGLPFVDLYARTGMNMVMYGRPPSEAKALARRFRRHGILRQVLLDGTGVVYDGAYGNKDPRIAAVDASGKPNFAGLCPTYTADRGPHFEQAPLDERIGRPVREDIIDGVAINWEPPGPFRGPDYCWCSRCLAAFAKETGIATETLEKLGPKGVMATHGKQWLRFRARLEGLIAKAYYDKCSELAEEARRRIWFVPLTAPSRFVPARPTREDIDTAIAGGDVEHPFHYRRFVHAYGPFTYAYYDVIARRWRGRHGVTLRHAREAATFARAQADVRPSRPVWLGIEGIQKGSHATLCWATTPERMALEIVGALAQGCEGVYVYTGRGMDGYYYAAAARAVRRAALLEQFVDHPLADDTLTFHSDLPGVTPKQIAVLYAYGRVFKRGEKRLLVLAGLAFKRELPFTVQVSGLAPDETYRVRDPITDEVLAGRDTWAGGELASGVTVTLKPGRIATFVVEPASHR